MLERERVLTAVLELLETDGLAGVSMRALARRLGVDPMALYHYFDDRDALLAEAAAHAYRQLDATLHARAPRGSWDDQLHALAAEYVELLANAGELVRYLAGHPAAAVIPIRLFGAHVHAALAPLALSKPATRVAHDVFVDFVHGFSIGIPRGGLTADLRRRLRAELAIVCAGIAAQR